MKVMDVLSEARSAISAREVFGEPIEKNGVTLIPAAKISGGGGGGGDGNAQQAGGAGFGVMSHPAGAFVIKGSQVTWHPAIDVNRIVLMGQVVAIVALLTVRTAIKARARRD